MFKLYEKKQWGLLCEKIHSILVARVRDSALILRQLMDLL